MSSPPWYMCLPYGISLPLQMCTRNRISPLKEVHKSHIEMKKLSGIHSRVYCPLFDTNRQRGQREKKERDEGMNKENDAWGVQDEWENEAQNIRHNKMLQSIR